MTAAKGRRARLFENPVLPGFYPDPSVCRVGPDFYLVTSSFEYFPGIPIFHSRDLVHWRQLGHVLTRKRQLDLTGVPSSGGLYAPTLRHYRGRFYLVCTHIGRGGNFCVTARRPEGPWSDPVWLDDDGIDPSLLLTEEGAFYTRNGPGRDFDHPLIYQARFDADALKLAGRPRPIFAGLGGIWPEAPHLYRIAGSYYLMTAEGGTSYGHSVMIARSSAPFGPFEPCPHNPILSHSGRPRHAIQATGHADLVELDDGTWWALLLGIRPSGGRYHHLGRETFLAPVTWGADGWPRIGSRLGIELEMPAPALTAPRGPAPRARHTFDGAALGPEWCFVRNPVARDWSLRARPGFLRLRGAAAALGEVGSPAAVLRRQQHFDVRCRTRVHFDPRRSGEEAGVIVRANEENHYTLSIRLGAAGREGVLEARTGGETRVVRRVPIAPGPAVLEISATAKAYSFAVASASGEGVRLGQLPTRPLSSEAISRAGRMHFTGVCLGMFASGNGRRSSVPADFEWFEYRPDLAVRRSVRARGPG